MIGFARSQALAGVLGIAAFLLAGSVFGRPVEFDPLASAPRVEGHSKTQVKLRDFLRRAPQMSLADRVRDATSECSWAELTWQLNRMAQAGMALPDLAEFGLERREDGAYIVDLAENPQWEVWDLKLSLFQDPESFERYAKALRERGFREQDLLVLREFVNENPPARTVLRAERAMLSSITSHRARAVRLKQRVDDAAYAYQINRARERATKDLAADLLSRMDPAPQRILTSYLQELGGKTLFIPEPNFDAGIAYFAQGLATGAYERQLVQQEQELSK